MPNHAAADQVVQAIHDRKASIGICGLGYVGLPLVAAFRRAGFKVWGFDIDDAKIEALKAGESYIAHIDFEALRTAYRDGLFVPTSDFEQIDQPDIILIAVPTPLTKTREPDLRAVEGTCRQIAAKLRRNQLVVLESTTYPMTTEEVCRPILDSSGLAVGQDYFLAYSPEREDPGNAKYETTTIPKVVGANDDASRKVAEAVYGAVIDRVVPVSDMAAAELCKIFENTFRAVNIALVNELKMMCQRMGIDVWEVIDAAATKPFGFMPFYPGPGLGGHCIPIDPFYLTWKAREYDFSHALHRAGGRDQYADAVPRRRRADARAQRTLDRPSRGPHLGAWRRVQKERRRRPGVALAQDHRPSQEGGGRDCLQRSARPADAQDATLRPRARVDRPDARRAGQP